jgi:hypothetical protein
MTGIGSRVRAVAGASALVFLAAACGTTVPHDQRVAAQSRSGSEFASGSADAEVPEEVSDTTLPAESAAGEAVVAAGGAAAPTPSGGGVGAAGAATARQVSVAPGTRGVTDTSLKIGILDYNTAAGNAINLATGGGEVAEEGALNNRQTYEAVIEYVNRKGGLAGRKIVPVFVPQDVAQYATASGRQREQQRACDAFTQDHQVFAIQGAGATEELMQDCAVRNKTLLLASRIQSYPDQKRFAAISDYWYAPHGFVAERRERGLAFELLAQGFFTKGAKVALMIEDRPGIRSGVSAAKRVLQEAGVQVAHEIVYPDFLTSPWETYILQLQQRGVTHVVMSATSGASQSTRSMMQAAENQRFRPRWGIATDNRPKDLFGSNAPREQLANTQGMGWSGAEDIQVRLEDSRAGAECLQAVPKGTAEDRHVACDLVFFLRSVFERIQVISPAGFARAAESLGTGYVGQYTHGGVSRFGPGRHDGVEVVRAFAFDDRCGQEGASCFKYVNGAHPLKW